MLDARIKAALELVTTATLTTVLLKKGLRNVWIRGAKPLTPQGKRIVGEAFTLLTAEPSPDVAPLHIRQIVLPEPSGWLLWLDPSSPVPPVESWSRVSAARVTE